MMENSKLPAFPIDGNSTGHPSVTGLTKREYFAAMAMQGLLANRDSDHYSIGDGLTTDDAENKAKFCIIMADALLTQLEKK